MVVAAVCVTGCGPYLLSGGHLLRGLRTDTGAIIALGVVCTGACQTAPPGWRCGRPHAIRALAIWTDVIGQFPERRRAFAQTGETHEGEQAINDLDRRQFRTAMPTVMKVDRNFDHNEPGANDLPDARDEERIALMIDRLHQPRGNTIKPRGAQ